MNHAATSITSVDPSKGSPELRDFAYQQADVLRDGRQTREEALAQCLFESR